MGGGMRAVKIAAIVMGVLIVLGTTVVLVTIVKRTMTGPAAVPEKAFAAILDEPAGTAIVGIASVRDRLAVQLRGGGVDRVLLIDPVSGVVVGRVGAGPLVCMTRIEPRRFGARLALRAPRLTLPAVGHDTLGPRGLMPEPALPTVARRNLRHTFRQPGVNEARDDTDT